MQTLNLDLTKRYTYADYLTWIDDKRRELFEGFVRKMTAPFRLHQKTSLELVVNLHSILTQQKCLCEIYEAPFDVRLPNNGKKRDKDIFTVVQPDICIICDKNKLDERGCLGAPDFIAEIVSKNNVKRDTEEKFKLYEKHGVREYWTVFPEIKTINAFLLNNNGKYELQGIFSETGKVRINIFDDVFINLEDIFQDDE